MLKSTLSCSCCSCKHNFSTFILNPDQDLWFILPYPVLIEHESASIHSIYASNPRDAHILHLSWTCLKSCLIFFLARPKVLTKHCLALVHKSSWIYSKILLYFLKCTNPRSYDLVLLQPMLIYTLILTFELNNNSLTSDKSFPRIPRVQNPVMPHPWMQLYTSHGCRVGTGKPTNLEVATRYIFLVKPLLNCTQHSAVKWRISYHSKETRVSQSHRVIYNIQPWIYQCWYVLFRFVPAVQPWGWQPRQWWSQCTNNTTTP